MDYTKMTTDELLQHKGSEYGSFTIQVKAIKDIMNILRNVREQGHPLDYPIEDQDVLNFFLVLKLVRAQTAKDLDSYADLAGYATLIKNYKKEKQGGKNEG